MHVLSVLTVVALLAHTQAPAPAKPATQKPAAVRPAAKGKPVVPSKTTAEKNAEALQQQVMLDRAGFSPGVIDGRPGANTSKALAVFQAQNAGGSPAPVEPFTRY